MATRNAVKLKIKVGDRVQVITGDDKGKQGDVLAVYKEKNKVLVEGVRMVKKHQKPTNENPGGIIEQPSPIHVSNVMVVDGTGEPSRIGRRMDNGKLVRFSKKSEQTI